MSQYLPSFFAPKVPHTSTLQNKSNPTQTTTIDIPLSPLVSENRSISAESNQTFGPSPTPLPDSITIFGFSPTTLPYILNTIEKYKPESVEYHSNYINIVCDPSHYKSILSLNRAIINKEIIGVFRNCLINNEYYNDNDYYNDWNRVEKKKKVGFFRNIFEWFF
ncbi:hypothetical protein CDIK_3455 [Cucumispora dikerogammari]|nr:hypothetical protein CDIK_3455 [Cucumispora dikerogammari]